MGSVDDPEARLERLFARFEGVGAPIWSGDLRSVSDVSLEQARERAVDAATRAGRLALLDDALEFVDKGYARRVSGDTAWTGIVAVGPSYDGRYRADSQVVLEDLVLAMVVLDVAPESVTEPLRVDGERLLRITADDVESPLREEAAGEAANDDGAPPLDPHPAPLTFNFRGVGLGVLILLAVTGTLMGTMWGLAALVALIVIAVEAARRRMTRSTRA